MARAFIIMLDSFGLGATADAHKYGDEGANTFIHLVEACLQAKADLVGVRSGALHIPNLTRLGLYVAAAISQDKPIHEFNQNISNHAMYGCAAELSLGKDTQSGHWEMAGVPVLFDWGYFPPAYPSFPQPLLDALIKQGNLPGVLGNKHASGTVIIEELGQEHQETGKPIVYTSA